MHTSLQFTPPPRHVPLSLRIVNFFNPVAQIGFFVFGFGMIFYWAFAGNADFSFLTFRGPHARATGRLLSVQSTGASENDQSIEAFHYEFTVNGERILGTSYTTGRTMPEGDTVPIEYSPDDPYRSRIAGMRRAHFGPGVLFVTIFPIIGLVVLVLSTKVGAKRNRLLRNGLFTTGVLKSKEPTNMTVNKRRVYELRFDFVARNGQRYEATARTTDTTRLEDETQEPLLYDPDEPTRAYVLDEAPARPHLEMNGDLKGKPVAAIFALIIPTLVIAGNTLAVLFKLDVL